MKRSTITSVSEDQYSAASKEHLIAEKAVSMIVNVFCQSVSKELPWSSAC